MGTKYEILNTIARRRKHFPRTAWKIPVLLSWTPFTQILIKDFIPPR